MSYAASSPNEPLRPWVDLISSSSDGESPPVSPIRVLPRAQTSLLLTWGPQGLRAEVLGPRTQPLLVWDHEPVDKIEIHLRPGVLSHWIGGAARDVVETSAALEDLLRIEQREAWKPLEDAPKQERLRRVEAWLADELPRATSGKLDAVDRALERIHASGGRLPVAELGAGLGVHPRSLERHFKARLGLSPKRYSRVVRFEGAVEELRRGKPAVEVAAQGFSDQAHLSREIRHFAGRSARQLGLLP